VLMVRSVTDLRQRGMEMHQAVVRGAQDCLRPILLAWQRPVRQPARQSPHERDRR